MNVLFVMMSPVEDLTSAVLRNIAVIRGLLLNGYKVTLLCLENSVCSTANNISKYTFLNDVKIIRVSQSAVREKVWEDPKKKTFKAKTVNLLRKVYHAFSVLGSSKSIAKGIKIDILNGQTEYDIVISSSDPKTAHIAVNELIKQGLKTGRWIQYWGDPLTLDMTRKSLCPKGIVKHIEENLIKDADQIIYVSPFTLKSQKKMFNKYAEKMKWLPIPFIEEKISDKENNDTYVISYIGNYQNDVRNIIPFYEAVSCLKTDFQTYIVGDGEPKLQNTDCVSVIHRSEANSIEKESDLLVSILNRYGTQIPGKVYHQAATDKPILIILDGDVQNEMKNYLQIYKRFTFCGNTKEEIVNAILNIRENNIKYSPCMDLAPACIVKKMLS